MKVLFRITKAVFFDIRVPASVYTKMDTQQKTSIKRGCCVALLFSRKFISEFSFSHMAKYNVINARRVKVKEKDYDF